MPLATGTVPATQSVLYEAPQSGAVVTSVTVVNANTGTGSYTLNLFLRRRGRTPIRMIPRDTTVGTEEAVQDETYRRLNPGDRIEGAADVGGTLDFTIEGP